MAGTNFKVKNGLEIQSGTVIAGGGAGTSGQVLSSTGTGVQWVNAATGTGDVVGPASATDNAVVRFDGTTGKLIQNSTVTLSDTGILTVPELSTTSITSTGNNPIVIAPDGTGDVHLNADSVRIGDNNADATIATRGTGDLLLTTNEGSAVEGVIRIYDGANGNITLTPNGTGQVQVGSDQVVTLTASQTLTNKTLSSNSVWNGNVIGSAYGGAGTVNGILKANGSGTVSAASAGTDYVTSVSVTSPVSNTGTTANPTIALASGYGDTQNPYGSKTANYFLAAPDGSAGSPTFRAIVAADIPTLNQNTTGNAATASALQTARNINGVSFNGTADITVTAAANTLTGTTLASGVTASSLTSVGTLTGLTVTRTTSGDTGTFTNTSTTNQSANVNAVSDNSTAISLRVFGSAAGSYGMLAANSTALYTTATSLNLCADNASGVIKFSTGSSVPERMRLDASGNLGLGTSSPISKLHVYTAATNKLTLDSPTANDNRLDFAKVGTVKWSMYSPANSNDLRMYDHQTVGDVVTFQSGGNVGLGTASPYNKVEIEGASARLGLNNGGGASRKALLIEPLGYGGNAYARLESYDYGTSTGGVLALNVTGGNVGIGLTTPSQKLEVANGYALFGGLRINGADASVNQIWQSNSGTNLGIMANGGAILFGQTSSEKMRLDASGNLGIGGTASSGTRLYVVGSNTTSNTSIPIYANQVYGNTGVSSAALRLNLNDGAGGCYLYGYSGGAGFMHNAEYLAGTGWTARSTFASIMETTSSGFSFYLNSSLTAGNTFTPSERMRIDSSGNVGIGRTPSYTLDLAGDARFKRNSGSGWVFQTPSSDMRIVGETSGAHLCFIPSSANVGIDTTSPSEKLNVIGKIKASDVLLGNNGTKGYGAITTTTSTSTPTGGSSGDHYYIY